MKELTAEFFEEIYPLNLSESEVILKIMENDKEYFKKYKDYINNEKYRKDFSPIDENNPHAFGRIFSKAYLRHLFNINEILGLRIASTLNLGYYLNLMTIMRQKIQAGDFSAWSRSWFRDMEDRKGM